MTIENALKTVFRCFTCLFLFVLGQACVAGDDFVDDSGLADTTMTSRGISATGARYLRPPDNYTDHPFAGQPATVAVAKKETLPREKLAVLKRGLTEAEVEELFGEPCLEVYQAIDTDTGGEDWNARVMTWQFQDPDHRDLCVTRDLDLFFGEVSPQNPLPDRPDVPERTWVLIRWELN